MTPEERPAFVATLVGLAAIKPGVKFTAEAFEIYWAALQDWDLAEFKAAAAQLSKSVEFIPNPYHFEQLRKAAGETPAEAWTRVLAAIRTAYPDQRISVDPRIDRIVRAMGGYRALALAEAQTTHWRAKQFAELWDQFGEADEARLALPSLAPPNVIGPTPVRALLEKLRS